MDLMAQNDLEQAIARAVVEGSFRARLLADPADALADYGLREGQRSAIESIRESSLAGFVARLFSLRPKAWDVGLDGVALDGEGL